MVEVARNHVTTGLAPLAVGFRTETPLRYETIVTADGVSRPAGGATLTLLAEALDYDEMQSILVQLGLSSTTPSALVTVRALDLYRLPRLYHGVVTLTVDGDAGGWWERVRLEFTGLAEVT